MATALVGITGTPVGPRDLSYTPPAGAYYAAPDGSDSNTGTSADSPWTLARALKDAPPSATIVLRGGTYAAGEFIINKNYTIQPYLSEKPVLDGGETVTTWAVDGDDWVTDWNTLFPKVNNPSNFSEDEARTNKDRVWINGEMQKRVKKRDDVVPGTFYVDYGAKKVYIGTDPSGKSVALTRYRYGFQRIFWAVGGVPNGAEERGLTVRGITFTHYAQNGIWMRTGDLVAEDNIFTQISDGGLLTYNTKHIIRNNEFSYNGMQGLHVGGGNQVLFENNIVRGNVLKDESDAEPRGVKFGSTDNSIIRNNLVENNNAIGIWLDVGSDDVKIVYNLVRNNTDLGIHFEISNRAIIAGNIAVGNKIGIYVQISSNGKVYNNTLVNNGEPMHVLEWIRTDADSNQGPGKTENTDIKNNIFFNGTSTDWPWSLFTARSADGMCKQPLISAMDNNAYYRSDAAQPTFVVRWDPIPNCNDVTFTTLAAFSSATGFEKHGIEVSGADTFFVNAGGGDYHLKAGSPAIGTGAPLPNDVANILGWVAGVPVDLGALQTTSTNLLANSGFELPGTAKSIAAGWKLKGSGKRMCNKVDRPGKPDKIVAREGVCAYQLGGASKLSQTFAPQNMGAGITLTFDGYVQGKGVTQAGVTLKVKYADKTSGKAQIPLPAGDYDYQAINGTLSLEKEVSKLKTMLVYSGTQGKVFFDELSLHTGGVNLSPLPLPLGLPEADGA